MILVAFSVIEVIFLKLLDTVHLIGITFIAIEILLHEIQYIIMQIIDVLLKRLTAMVYQPRASNSRLLEQQISDIIFSYKKSGDFVGYEN